MFANKKNVRILIVDDDPQLRKFLRISLSLYGCEIVEAENGKQGTSMASTENPDIIILDVELPDMKGNDVVSNVREWSKVPIIVLTSKTDESDKLEALDKKADEFVEKPFDVAELIRKIERLLKISVKPEEPENAYRIGNIKVDFSAGNVSIDDRIANLSATEFNVLKALIFGSGKVVTFKQLLREIPENERGEGLVQLRIIIEHLRKIIEKTPELPELIILEPKIGYRFQEPNS